MNHLVQIIDYVLEKVKRIEENNAVMNDEAIINKQVLQQMESVLNAQQTRLESIEQKLFEEQSAHRELEKKFNDIQSVHQTALDQLQKKVDENTIGTHDLDLLLSRVKSN